MAKTIEERVTALETEFRHKLDDDFLRTQVRNHLWRRAVLPATGVGAVLTLAVTFGLQNLLRAAESEGQYHAYVESARHVANYTERALESNFEARKAAESAATEAETAQATVESLKLKLHEVRKLTESLSKTDGIVKDVAEILQPRIFDNLLSSGPGWLRLDEMQICWGTIKHDVKSKVSFQRKESFEKPFNSIPVIVTDESNSPQHGGWIRTQTFNVSPRSFSLSAYPESGKSGMTRIAWIAVGTAP